MTSKITAIALAGIIGLGVTTTNVQSAKAEPISIGIGLYLLTKAIVAKTVIVGVTAAKVGASKAVITGAAKGGAMAFAKHSTVQGGKLIIKQGARKATQNGAIRGAMKAANKELQDQAQDKAKTYAY